MQNYRNLCMYRRPRKVAFQFAKAFGYYICICLVSGVA
jgi:hypothetical protein